MFALVVYISLGARSTYPDPLTLLPESTFARTPFFAPPFSLFARGLTLPIDHQLILIFASVYRGCLVRAACLSAIPSYPVFGG